MEEGESVLLTEIPESRTPSTMKRQKSCISQASVQSLSHKVSFDAGEPAETYDLGGEKHTSISNYDADDDDDGDDDDDDDGTPGVILEGGVNNGNRDVKSYDEVPTESDYDTDLEMDDDKWLYPEKYERDTTGIAKYKRACEEEGVQPIRFVVRHIQDVNFRLKHHGLGLSAVKALSAPLETNTTMEQIDLEGNWIMTQGTNYLCQVLRENVYVTDLNLSENKIDSEGAISVCELLIGNRSIEFLNLAGNDIGNRSAKTFYELLTKNSVLKSLNLRHNKFEDSSAYYFKEALMENETLRFLDLSWNCFQSKGCVQLAEGLKENVGLIQFLVAMNGFGLEGGLKIGEAIQANRKLHFLDTSYCRFPKEVANSLAHGLHHNDYLEIIDISNNFIHDEGAYQILSAIDKNESSNLELLNLGSTIVHDDFKKLEDKLGEQRGLKVKHGGVGYTYVKQKEYDPMAAFLRDPMTKLKEWVEQAGYRMIDLLKYFDRDGSMSISRDEFRQGIRSTSIPITDQQLDILIERLDTDGDGEIDYKELVEGDKENRKAKRDVQRILFDLHQKKAEQVAHQDDILFGTTDREDLVKTIV